MTDTKVALLLSRYKLLPSPPFPKVQLLHLLLGGESVYSQDMMVRRLRTWAHAVHAKQTGLEHLYNRVDEQIDGGVYDQPTTRHCCSVVAVM